MKLSDRSSRLVGVVFGVIAFLVAMNVYIFAPIHHSFRTGWIPYVTAWVVYRVTWARLSLLRRCPAGCGARIYYGVEVCPHCRTPLRVHRGAERRMHAVP